VKATLLGVASFAVGSVLLGFALSLLLLLSPAPHRPDTTGDFLMAGIYYGYSAAFKSIGFLIPTAFSRSWRRLGALRAVVIAGALGVLSPIAYYAVAALIAKPVLPLFHSAPWLATAILFGVPGVALGVLAAMIARARPGR
jgi:hypothetical protein